MKTIKVIPTHLMLIKSLAKDYDKQTTWKELYGELFIEGSNIYDAFLSTLTFYRIKDTDQIDYFKVDDMTKEHIVEFEEYDSYIKDITNDKEYNKPKKSTMNAVLKRLGYIAI